MAESTKIGRIQYPFAYDENGSLVFIEDVNPELRHEHLYHCPCCGASMNPRLGKVNAHCFAHATNQSCNVESYLHSTAKDIIVRKIRDGKFVIRMGVHEICSSRSCTFDHCSRPAIREYNLAEIYDLPPAVEESLYVDETRFVPDVTLLSSDSRRSPICIEIFYSHSCSEKKISLCQNVIEIPVKNFHDLIDLRERRLDDMSSCLEDDGYGARFINFNKRRLKVSSDVFKQGHPRCTWGQEERITEARKCSEAWRLFRYESGRYYVEASSEMELNSHQDTILYEIVIWDGRIDDAEARKYLLGIESMLFPERRICWGCRNCKRNYEGYNSCDLSLNETDRIEEYKKEKAATCQSYSARHTDYQPRTMIWTRATSQWQDVDFQMSECLKKTP